MHKHKKDGIDQETIQSSTLTQDTTWDSNKKYNKHHQQEHIHLLSNKTIDDLCFGRHGVLLNSKLSASVNMTFTFQ